MGLPNIQIIFQKAAADTVKLSTVGRIGAVIIRDGGATAELYKLNTAADIPTGLSAGNKAYVERAFIGNDIPPKFIYLYVLAADAADLGDALEALETVKVDYMCVPPEGDADDVTEAETWIKAQWEKDIPVRAVLPNKASDFEGIVNFTTGNIIVDGVTLSTAAFCSRIMGLIIGTSLERSCTNAVLVEVSNCDRLSKADMDDAIDAGEFLIYHDGEKVKVARGVTSLTTLSAAKTADYQKIKIIDTICLTESDLKLLIEDNYIGKVANTYDNKCLLISAIDGYFTVLEKGNIFAEGSTADIDISSQLAYINGLGVDTADLSEQDIKEYPTGSDVYLLGTVKILDAIEDIKLSITH